MRHGKSDWSQQADDFDRPLNKRGQGDLPHVARMLGTVESGLPDLVISSSSQRARETATGVVQALGSHLDILFQDSLYLAGVGAIRQALGGAGRCGFRQGMGCKFLLRPFCPISDAFFYKINTI